MGEGEGGGRRGSEKGRERERERGGVQQRSRKSYYYFYLIDSQVDACVGYDSHQTRSESSIKSSASLVSYDLPETVSHTSVLAGFSQGKSSLKYLTYRMEKACWSLPSNHTRFIIGKLLVMRGVWLIMGYVNTMYISSC